MYNFVFEALSCSLKIQRLQLRRGCNSGGSGGSGYRGCPYPGLLSFYRFLSFWGQDRLWGPEDHLPWSVWSPRAIFSPWSLRAIFPLWPLLPSWTFYFVRLTSRRRFRKWTVGAVGSLISWNLSSNTKHERRRLILLDGNPNPIPLVGKQSLFPPLQGTTL